MKKDVILDTNANEILDIFSFILKIDLKKSLNSNVKVVIYKTRQNEL